MLALTRADLDITSRDAVFACIAKEKPEVIINCAAYTAVDKAETEVEKAHAVNQTGPRYLAEAARQHNALLVHISTDFVFDGSQGRPESRNLTRFRPMSLRVLSRPLPVEGSKGLKERAFDAC